MTGDRDTLLAGRDEGGRRKDAAHAQLEARRKALVRRARRALLAQALATGEANADDVADLLGDVPADIDPRWRGTVPGPLARAGIIRRVGFEPSCRPSRHASTLSRWALADASAARGWLAAHPDIPDPELDDDAGAPCQATPRRPSSSPSQSAVMQPSLF